MVGSLVAQVFRDQVAPLFSPEGVEEFLRYAAPEAIRARSEGNHVVLVATLDRRIVGAIEVRDHNHVSLLFVQTACQRQGVGRGLLREAVALCRRHRPALQAVDVHASPNAVAAYQRFGFRRQGPERMENGMRFVPMVLEPA